MSSPAQNVGEELTGTCVTSRKVKVVQQTLRQQTEPHLCALKLLQCFFSNEELARSNTDGTYGKQTLDSAKLNSLKVLVFTKFPVSNNEAKLTVSVGPSADFQEKTHQIVHCKLFVFF